MTDDLDRAADLAETERKAALDRHAARERPVARLDCRDCHEPLEAARIRLAAERCVDCQNDFDLKARRYAR